MAGRAQMANPIRAYVYTLRKLRNLTQEEVADGAGLKRRTYIAWENGETAKLDLEVAQNIVEFLGGAFEHLGRVTKMSPEAAAELASAWAAMSPEEQAASLRPTDDKVRQLIAISVDDPEGLADVLRDVRNEARADDRTLDMISVFLAGLRGGRRIRGE
jgi:transcriptional regulator with XRE-family HTH domain